MIEVKSKLRRWGNSLGIVIPQNAIEIAKVKEGDEINVFLQEEKSDLKSIFGKLRKWKIYPQKFKDEIRKEEAKIN